MIKILTKKFVAVSLLSLSGAAMADYPVGVQDHYKALANQSHSFFVLDNDIGENLRLVKTNSWTLKGGRAEIRSQFELRKRYIYYTAPAGFTGEDEFWYVFEDEQGRTNAAKATVTVRSEDAVPLLPGNDDTTVQKNKTIRINVMKNDNDQFSRIVEFNDWSEKGGKVTMLEGFANRFSPYLTYTPPQDFVGTDTFWYVVGGSDPDGFKNAAKVTVTVTEADKSGDYPTGSPDNLQYVRGGNLFTTSYYPLDNDSGSELQFVGEGGYSELGGTYILSKSGAMSYYPPSGFSGQDRVWYVFEDALGRTNWSVVTFNVD
ncbi:Ig-like domain-containing protein [Leucothrix pacifica]|uniref:Uncharacterized protein n=1 Tax=Leucothrix pacifica TaxID=1247513 RepID=A0A317CCK3_9GAMM|nr:Ig-like domain-containing protein [Leucothrix pacifica]PWQ95073.1 hypothetical protein DKW60_15660 [Leucothrix pacifica]